MKNKIFPLFLIFILLLIFLIFYKGLQKSNIYTPDTNINKNIPSFRAKIFETEEDISSEEILKTKNFI